MRRRFDVEQFRLMVMNLLLWHGVVDTEHSIYDYHGCTDIVFVPQNQIDEMIFKAWSVWIPFTAWLYDDVVEMKCVYGRSRNLPDDHRAVLEIRVWKRVEPVHGSDYWVNHKKLAQNAP